MSLRLPRRMTRPAHRIARFQGLFALSTIASSLCVINPEESLSSLTHPTHYNKHAGLEDGRRFRAGHRAYRPESSA